jgi:hypothetical protein
MLKCTCVLMAGRCGATRSGRSADWARLRPEVGLAKGAFVRSATDAKAARFGAAPSQRPSAPLPRCRTMRPRCCSTPRPTFAASALFTAPIDERVFAQLAAHPAVHVHEWPTSRGGELPAAVRHALAVTRTLACVVGCSMRSRTADRAAPRARRAPRRAHRLFVAPPNSQDDRWPKRAADLRPRACAELYGARTSSATLPRSRELAGGVAGRVGPATRLGLVFAADRARRRTACSPWNRVCTASTTRRRRVSLPCVNGARKLTPSRHVGSRVPHRGQDSRAADAVLIVNGNLATLSWYTCTRAEAGRHRLRPPMSGATRADAAVRLSYRASRAEQSVTLPEERWAGVAVRHQCTMTWNVHSCPLAG